MGEGAGSLGVLVTVDMYGRVACGAGGEESMNGRGEVVICMTGVRCESRLQDLDRAFVITRECDVTIRYPVKFACGQSNDYHAICSRQFASVGVALLDRAWDHIAPCDFRLVWWTGEDEGCCTKVVFEGAIADTYCRACLYSLGKGMSVVRYAKIFCCPLLHSGDGVQEGRGCGWGWGHRGSSGKDGYCAMVGSDGASHTVREGRSSGCEYGVAVFGVGASRMDPGPLVPCVLVSSFH